MSSTSANLQQTNKGRMMMNANSLPRTLKYSACALLMIASIASAQDTDTDESSLADFYIGIYGGFGLVNHNATVSPRYFNGQLSFPDEATFRSGEGSGIHAGALFELPFSQHFALGARVGYQVRDGLLTQRYTNTTDVINAEGSNIDATVEGKVDAAFSYLSFTPHVKVTPSSLPLYFYGGPTLLYSLGATRTYTEGVASPRTGVYSDNQRRTRTLARGDMSEAKTIVPAVSLGLGYDFQFSPSFGAFLEFEYSPTLTDMVDGLGSNEQWTSSRIAGTVGLRFGVGVDRTPMAPPVAVRETPRPETSGSVGDTALIEAGGLTADGLSDTLTISGRRVRETEVHALLPYIFFARDSAEIPARYVQIARRDRSNFQVERLERGSTLQLYYHLLNVIGQRLSENRRAEITLTGCTSQFENDTALALRRAEAVRDYLVDVWRVRENRIKVVGRGLPTNPSLSEVDTAEAARENQRVEISSEDYSILAPVQLPDTAYLAPAGIVRFIPPQSDSISGAEYWNLDVMIGDSLIENAVTGYGPPPREIDFTVENRPDLNLSGPVTISSRLVLRDTLFEELARWPSEQVVLRRQGEFLVEREVVGGKFIDTYNLLLFSFDNDAILDFTQQATTIMRDRISPASTVRVIGHTDRIGLPPYNRELSLRRAQVAANALGIQANEVVGLGERQLLYDNTYPEGRYYCRTVTVRIETPARETQISEAEENARTRRRR